MQRIRDNLWITDIDAVKTRSTERFDTVVSVCQDTARENVSCNYQQYRLADGFDSMARWGGTIEYEVFEKAAETVLTRMQDECVLVHCHAGRNRSAAVCAAAIGVEEGINYEEAIKRVEDARPIANPVKLMADHARRFIDDRT